MLQSATGYFFLVKEGPHFTAIPVREWYNFRPSIRHQTLTLEEAERQMNSQGQAIRLAAGSKLAAMAAKAAEEGEEVLDGDESGDEPDSDEEERRVQRVKGSTAAAMENAAAADGAAEDEDMPGAQVAVDKGEKGEDWEHEDEHADDDLNQGDEAGSDADAPTTGKRSPRPSSGSDDEDGLTAAGQEVQRILRKTHLGSDSEEADGTPGLEDDDDEEEDDDDDDDVDLDAMASGIMPKVKGVKEGGTPSASTPASRRATPQPGQRGATPQPGIKGASKRKAVTPPTHEDAKKVKAEVKTEVKQEATSQPRGNPSAVQKLGNLGAALQGPPTQAEIVAALRDWGPVTTSELTSRFKKRIVAQADKKNFMAVVKHISKLEEMPPGSGKKFVVLRS